MKPGTPLPWSIRKNETTRMVFLTGPGFPLYKAERPYSIAPPSQPEQNREQDAAYIVHAANTYPKLVEALKAAHYALSLWGGTGADVHEDTEPIEQLLAECGEE